MKMTLENLDSYLKQDRLAPAYLLSGDEELLVIEAADRVRAAARAAGFSEREVYFPERGSDWSDIMASSRSMSLFGDRRIIEVRFNGKAGKEGGAALVKLVETTGSDVLLLIITPRLEPASQSTSWVKAIEAQGAWIPVWNVGARQLEAWLVQRCKRAGLELNAEAVALLAARVEGNLLAAHQEIEKLKLLVPTGTVDAAAVLAAVAHSARYDVFILGEAVINGDAARAANVIAGLRGEGVEPTLILWSLVRELRNMWSLNRGDDPARRSGLRMSPVQIAALEGARRRSVRMPFARLSSRALRVDRMIKGRLAGDPWDELLLLCSEFCGLRVV